MFEIIVALVLFPEFNGLNPFLCFSRVLIWKSVFLGFLGKKTTNCHNKWLKSLVMHLINLKTYNGKNKNIC